MSDLVLVVDEPRCRGYWPTGLIEEVYADDLGMVRFVKIRLSTWTLVRDIRKICLLEAVE